MLLPYYLIRYILKRKRDSKKSSVLLSSENVGIVKADMTKMSTIIEHRL